MTFAFAGHELDLRRQELRRGDAVLHVEPQVFDLLRFLIENHDRLVEEYLALDYAFVESNREEKLGFIPNDWEAVRAVVDARPGA